MSRRLFFAAAFVTACGGDAIDNGRGPLDDGGADVTGSKPDQKSPSVAAQAAVTEMIGPNMSGNGCPASGPQFTPPPNTDPVSGTTATLNCDLSAGTGCSPAMNVVVDRDQNAIVVCKVSGNGPFSVTANLSQGSVAFNVAGTFTVTGGTGFVSSG